MLINDLIQNVAESRLIKCKRVAYLLRCTRKLENHLAKVAAALVYDAAAALGRIESSEPVPVGGAKLHPVCVLSLALAKIPTLSGDCPVFLRGNHQHPDRRIQPGDVVI
jgi:hypothetical protein